MKKIAIILFVFMGTFSQAQTLSANTPPQVNVSGEGKISVMPDEAVITVGVENTGQDSNDVKKKNDAAVDAVIKYLKNFKLPASDYQTKRVYLNRNYDYNKKKYSYMASQAIEIHLKDLSKYDALMMGLVDAGVNNIQGVQFKTSKQSEYESQARVKAAQNAREKGKDYAGALNKKLGDALLVTDNSQSYYPVAMSAMRFDKAESAEMPKETLAIGEITITANVNISFSLLNK
ncbi:SIMPL domain-containing protein [Flavobacterium sp. MK4S-17]|uniref:SIMPL domain-containing protein n=1 Tax=Flavobacterium sp. MK4S-17 TaxID=2543737 RepID=UPI00135BEAF6|nr:SIMPL domain-containing protein [Flavobacterium sp. MK4S-17]